MARKPKDDETPVSSEDDTVEISTQKPEKKKQTNSKKEAPAGDHECEHEQAHERNHG